MATIYVRTSGNDTTGNGTTGTPYATLNKAFSVANAGGGDTILIGTGTYLENSGSGYLSLGRSFTSLVTITTETGYQDVVIKGSGTALTLVFGNVTNLWFENLIFEAQTSTVTSVVRFNGSINTVYFTRCRIRVFGSSSATNIGISSVITGGAALSTLYFVLCEVEQIGPFATAGILLDLGSGSSFSDLQIRDCSIRTGGFSMRLLGIQNVRISNNRCDSWSITTGATCFQLGVDGATGATCTGIITGNVFRTHTGHGAVIGAGCNGVVFSGNQVYGGNNSGIGQGLVIKDANNIRIVKNIIWGGYLSGLYLKAAQNCLVYDNDVYNEYANSAALRVGINTEDNSRVAGLVVRRNRFYANVGKAIDWQNSTGDAGGCMLDENVYDVTGTATLGTVRGTDVTTLAGLRAAWTGYTHPQNDRNSRLGSKTVISAGLPTIELT